MIERKLVRVCAGVWLDEENTIRSNDTTTQKFNVIYVIDIRSSTFLLTQSISYLSYRFGLVCSLNAFPILVVCLFCVVVVGVAISNSLRIFFRFDAI